MSLFFAFFGIDDGLTGAEGDCEDVFRLALGQPSLSAGHAAAAARWL